MQPEETQMLQQFLDQLTAVRGIDKDPDADARIRQALQQQPDAAYLLVQRAMILEQALSRAKAEISQLQQRTTPPASPNRFLDANAWGHGATPDHPSANVPVQRTHSTAPDASSFASRQGHQGLPKRGSFLGGAGGNMLGTMAATAAGVAGGAFLFHGIGNLFDGNDAAKAAKEPVADNTGNDTVATDETSAPAEADTATPDVAAADEGDLFSGDGGDADLGGGDDSLFS